MKNRVWELDALRGICILGMVLVHFVYDLTELYKVITWEYPHWFSFVMDWGGILFFLISGICATLGRHSVRRGLIVVACGFICTAVTYGMYRFGFAEKSLIIYFGALHCLGTCMILWWLCKRLPPWVIALLAAAMIAVGFYLRPLYFDCSMWLMPFGFTPKGFATSDYFPLLPYFGFFLAGAVLGHVLYRKKESLIPGGNTLPLRILRFCGRHSLWVYLLHQPVLSALSMGISMLVQ